MNYTSLDDAYKIYHTNSNTYGGSITYNPTCIYCSNSSSNALMQSRDGGSFRQCKKCRKNFRANIVNKPINNLSYSTQHLHGTN